jgi:hypothetical protein
VVVLEPARYTEATFAAMLPPTSSIDTPQLRLAAATAQLHAAPDAIDCHSFYVVARALDRGAGRVTTRTARQAALPSTATRGAPRDCAVRSLPGRAIRTLLHSAFHTRRFARVMRGWAEPERRRLSRWNHVAHLLDPVTEFFGRRDRGGRVFQACAIAERCTDDMVREPRRL